MFRSLFQRNRTVRVPIEHSGVHIQPVRLYQGPVRPSILFWTFVFGYSVFRLLESTQEQSEKDKSRQKWQEWKKKQGFGTEASHSDHWKKAHDAIQKTSESTTITSADSVDPAEPSTDVIGSILLPVWFRKTKRNVPYRESEPEFKEFVRFQSDEKKVMEVTRHVVQRAETMLKNPGHQNNLRYIGFKEGKVNVEMAVIPQLLPPDIYEVPSVIMFQDGIALGWKPLPPHLGSKMNTIFHPGSTFEAAKASVYVFFYTSYAIIKSKVSGTPLHLPRFPNSKSHNHTTGQVHERERPGVDNGIKVNDRAPPTSSISGQSIRDLLKSLHDGQSSAKLHTETVENIPFSYPIQAAARAFRVKQLQGLMQDRVDEARGSVKIAGKMYLRGTRGVYIVNVSALYLPAEDHFLGPVKIDVEIALNYAAMQKALDHAKKHKHLPECEEERRKHDHKKPNEDDDQIAKPDSTESKPSTDEGKPSPSEPTPGKEKE